MGTENTTQVIVTDIRMSFWSMVIFMNKRAIAAIPAFLILAIVVGVLSAILGGLGMIIGMGR